MDFPILSLIIFLPLLGATFIFLFRYQKDTNKSAIYVSIFTSLANLLLAFFLWFLFDNNYTGFQFIEEKNWPSFFKALRIIHIPVDKSDLSYIRKARERLIFDEFYAHHLKMDKFKHATKKKVGFKVQGNKALV